MAFEKRPNRGSIIFAGDNVLLYVEKQASMLAATAQAAEVSELKRKLGLADEDLVRINKIFDEAQGMFSNISFKPVLICRS